MEVVYKDREKDGASIVSFLNQVCEVEFEKYIESSYETLAKYVNAYDNKMVMKRENIADRGIWTAKKRYILNVWDSEGVRYEEPKLKMMGIEAVKSSTPAPCRAMIKNALKIMMNGTEEDVQQFIMKSRLEFKKLPPEDISFPRSISEITKHKFKESVYNDVYGDDGETVIGQRKVAQPIHVRGALLFNYLIKKNNLDHKYSLIQNGEKIKFCYLKTPNPYHENIISFIQDFPTELNFDKYIDYDLQFEKSFVEPLKIILNSIGWHAEKTITLESFFT